MAKPKVTSRDAARITLRVSDELRAAIDEAAAEREWSAAHFCARAIEHAVDEWRKAHGKPPLARAAVARRAPRR